MQKYKLKITHSYMQALCQWLDCQLSQESNTSFEQITVWVLLYKWRHSEQIRNLYTFRFEGKKKIALKPEIAAALASVINTCQQDYTSYMGNYLRIVSDEIYHFFNLKTNSNGSTYL